MHLITLDNDTDFEGWRKAARALVLNGVNPSDVTWNTPSQAPELFAPIAATSLPDVPHATFTVSAKFVELAQSAILHRDVERFRHSVSAAVAAAQPSRSVGDRDRP